jgi:hypothetical protein
MCDIREEMREEEIRQFLTHLAAAAKRGGGDSESGVRRPAVSLSKRVKC